MKRTNEQNGQDELFAEVMAGEEFDAFSQNLKEQGLQLVRMRRQSRRRRALVLQGACAIALCAGIWLYRPNRPLEVSVATPSRTSKDAAAAHYITEEQMLAMFPKGSCVVAEVNGKKELVFLEPQNAQRTTQ